MTAKPFGPPPVWNAGVLNLNAGQTIGADREGQPLFSRFGRAVETSMVGPIGSNTYHSLQTTLTKRYSSGLQANLTYTWSKVIGICCNEDNNGGPAVPALAFYDRNRTLLPWDRTHNFQTTLTYELPFGKGRAISPGNRFVSALISGWQINTLVSMMSGTPFTVTSDGASLRLPGSTQTADQLTPNVRTKLGVGRNVAWIDPTAFARVTEARFRTSGLNVLRGSGFVNSDLGLFRQVTIKERYNLQLRTELFNWTNTPKFNNPNAAANNLIFSNGQYSGGSFDITGTNSGGRDPNGDRILRIGLRLSF